MARKSLSKRKDRYQKQQDLAFKQVQSWLRRIRTRLKQGHYNYLTPRERERIESLLFGSILESWTAQAILAGVMAPRIFDLETSRLALHQVTILLRNAGNRRPAKPTKPKTIIRRAKASQGAPVPETGKSKFPSSR
jgi:hypothetical protein